MSNFIQKCLAQEVGLQDIDDFVDQWHDSAPAVPLHDFLGMTAQEYALWVSDASFLPSIVRLRSEHKSLDDILDEYRRCPPPGASIAGDWRTKALTDWLKEHHWERPGVK